MTFFTEKMYFCTKFYIMYLHERKEWWHFRFDAAAVMNPLASVRAKQGLLLGELSALGFSIQDEAVLENLTLEVVKSSEIEGENLNLSQVRSSIALRLGIPTTNVTSSTRYIDGVVEMMLDATQHFDTELSDERLFGWHNVLFPTGMSGLYKIDVGCYRSHEMQVVSGPMGHEQVHYQAPEPERIADEMKRFVAWFNHDDSLDPVLKAAVAHLWFVTIHPFDDGNGRIARALTEMLLARSDNNARRFYSMSNQIQIDKKQYYKILELTQKGSGDITEWLLWFLKCLQSSLDSTDMTLKSVMAKARFWESHTEMRFNDRQKKIINMLYDGFFGKLNTSKWAKIAKCSTDTALNDINDLVKKGVLRKNEGGGRSTSYSLVQ